MTAWQLASLPFWMMGFIFAIVAACLGLTTVSKEKLNERMGTAGLALLFGMPFLCMAAWMWG